MNFQSFKSKLADKVLLAMNDSSLSFRGFCNKKVICPLGCFDSHSIEQQPIPLIAAIKWKITIEQATMFIRGYDQTGDFRDNVGELQEWYDLGRAYRKKLIG